MSVQILLATVFLSIRFCEPRIKACGRKTKKTENHNQAVIEMPDLSANRAFVEKSPEANISQSRQNEGDVPSPNQTINKH